MSYGRLHISWTPQSWPGNIHLPDKIVLSVPSPSPKLFPLAIMRGILHLRDSFYTTWQDGPCRNLAA